jgi:hypothetical protein
MGAESRRCEDLFERMICFVLRFERPLSAGTILCSCGFRAGPSSFLYAFFCLIQYASAE